MIGDDSKKEKQYKKNIILRTIYYLVFIYLLIIPSPFITRNYKWLFFSYLPLLTVLFFIIILRTKKKIKNINNLKLISFWLIYITFLRLIGHSTAKLGNYFIIYNFFFLFFIMSFIETFFSKNKIKRLVKGLTISMIVNLFHNIYLNITNPGASTLIYTEYGKHFLKTNIGATTFSTLIFLMSGVFFLNFLNNKNFYSKGINLLLVLTSCYFIMVIQQRGTTSILTFIMLGFFMVRHLTKKFKKNQRGLLFGILMSGLMISLLIIGNVAINTLNDPRLASRLMSLKKLLQGNLEIQLSSTGSLSSRLYLIEISLRTFMSSLQAFFIGIGYNLNHFKSIYQQTINSGVGYHSELVDILPTYGIVGAIIIFKIFKNHYIYLKNKNVDLDLRIIYIFFLIYSILNRSFFFQLGVVITILIPLKEK